MNEHRVFKTETFVNFIHTSDRWRLKSGSDQNTYLMHRSKPQNWVRWIAPGARKIAEVRSTVLVNLDTIKITGRHANIFMVSLRINSVNQTCMIKDIYCYAARHRHRGDLINNCWYILLKFHNQFHIVQKWFLDTHFEIENYILPPIMKLVNLHTIQKNLHIWNGTISPKLNMLFLNNCSCMIKFLSNFITAIVIQDNETKTNTQKNQNRQYLMMQLFVYNHSFKSIND